MLVRTDPSHHRLAYLSIPRDLLVSIPGVGSTKINAAYQAGGTPLAINTVKSFTGVGIDHVVIVDFNNFKDLIDAEGGITVNVPEPILSNRFDCPFKTQARCQEWKGWRFQRGPQHMNGERALIYSRIRENQLNPGESDLTRGARQQAVAQAATAKLTSVSTLLGLPFNGSSLMKPLTTDLSTWQLMELGWVKFRASGSHTLYCRLGGRSDDRRRLLGDRPLRGQPRDARHVGGPFGAPAADDDLRARVPHRASAPVAQSLEAGVEEPPESPPLVLLEPPSELPPESATTTSPRSPSPSCSSARRGRSRSSRSPSPCSGRPPDAGRAPG